MEIKAESIEKTLAFWQQRTSRDLTEEDARQIMATLHELYCILRDWYIQDHPELYLPDTSIG